MVTASPSVFERALTGNRMHRHRIILWSVFLLLLVSQFPIFVQQTLTPDTVLYDIQARCVLNGGVLYRDVLEPNLPGIVWIHAVVRSVIGWSSPALHLFDLCVVLSIGLLLGRFAASAAAGQRQQHIIQAATLLGMMTFYLGTSEWCHCQRDTWLLLPCLLALMTRISVLRGMEDARSPIAGISVRQFASAMLEGIFWAVGFWLKPFVAIPALAVLVVSLRFSPNVRLWSMQTLAVLCGGVLTGAVGVVWMIQSGCWPHFLDMVSNWNGDYFQASRSRWTWDRFVSHAIRFQPWILLHIPAMVASVRTLWMRRSSASVSRITDDDIAGNLLAALYLGWLAQAFFLQQLFDYIHVPGILLALTINIKSACPSPASGGRQPSDTLTPPAISNISTAQRNLTYAATIVFACLVIGVSPIFRWHRQCLWLPCVRACLGTLLSPESRDRIAQIPFPRWSELQPMLDYARQIGIADKTLMAYNGNLIHLYPELGFQPATRFVYLDVLARSFPDQRDLMISAIKHSAVRYVMSDLREDGWEDDIPDGLLLPPSVAEHQAGLFFPYNQTPLFRSGGYVLFRIDQPVARLSSDYLPLAKP